MNLQAFEHVLAGRGVPVAHLDEFTRALRCGLPLDQQVRFAKRRLRQAREDLEPACPASMGPKKVNLYEPADRHGLSSALGQIEEDLHTMALGFHRRNITRKRQRKNEAVLEQRRLTESAEPPRHCDNARCLCRQLKAKLAERQAVGR